MNFTVAIDGPAGSGKSTIAKIVCKELGFTHIDTGAMYRAVGLFALNKGVDICNEEKINAILDDIEIKYVEGKIYLNGKDVSGMIRTPEVSNAASRVSSYKLVREKLVYLQQKASENGMYILDGRDIGYKVLPNANLKVFLTASIDCRAERRFKELPNANLEEIKEQIKIRDYNDSTRKESPLKQADDAILVDTTEMTIEQVSEKIISLIKERMC
ncbi:MAG: (d)CMP kinase [bacterium]|nr:(d)CMP kinase [bacterium]